MPLIKYTLLLAVVFAFGCVQKKLTPAQIVKEKMEDKPQFFVSPLPPGQWTDQNVLTYTEGYFYFPPPAGYRIMQYNSKPTSVVIDLFRQTLDIDTTLAKIISRRQGGDHCDFNDEDHERKADMDMIEVDADCYRWHSGKFKRKYYFLRNGNLVFTFRMLSTPDEFEDMEMEFDHFVSYTVAQYMQYPAEQDMLPYEHFADNELNTQLLAFFNPHNDSFAASMP